MWVTALSCTVCPIASQSGYYKTISSSSQHCYRWRSPFLMIRFYLFLVQTQTARPSMAAPIPCSTYARRHRSLRRTTSSFELIGKKLTYSLRSFFGNSFRWRGQTNSVFPSVSSAPRPVKATQSNEYTLCCRLFIPSTPNLWYLPWSSEVSTSVLPMIFLLCLYDGFLRGSRFRTWQRHTCTVRNAFNLNRWIHYVRKNVQWAKRWSRYI